MPCSRDGEWIWDDSLGWLSLDEWAYEFLPPPVPQPSPVLPRKRHKHTGMPTIYEEGIPGQNSQRTSDPASASGLAGGGSGASGLAAEGRNANNVEQSLHMLGSYLGRKKRYDNGGYRSAVRRQLKRLLQDNDIAFPDWLDDHTAPVMDWRDKAFKEIQSLTTRAQNWEELTSPSSSWNLQLPLLLWMVTPLQLGLLQVEAAGQAAPVETAPVPGLEAGANGLPEEGSFILADPKTKVGEIDMAEL